MKTQLWISTFLLVAILCSCTREQANNIQGDSTVTAATNKSALVTNYIVYVDKSAFDRMVGQQVRLAGTLVYAGKGTYDLQTTNGLVLMGNSLAITKEEAESSTTVVVEGVLEFVKAHSIPKDFDPLSMQSNFRPGQYIPEHFVLYHAKAISTD